MVRRVLTSSAPAALAGVLAVVLLLLRHDLPATDLARYAGYLALGIAFPGVLTWRLLLGHWHRAPDDAPTWLEDLSFGTVLGFGLQLPFFLLGVVVDATWLLAVPPALALLASLLPPGRRAWTLPTTRLHPAAAWGLAGVVVYGLLWLSRNAFPLRPLWLPPFKSPSIDETFHQALVADIGHRFPPQIPFLLDVRLDYHWFVHAQLATTEAAIGLDPVVTLRLVLPAVCLGLAVLGLGAVALRLTGRPVAAVVAPALLVVGAYQLVSPDFFTGTFYEPYVTKRFVSSPSQSYGVMMSVPALVLILEVLHPRRRTPWPTWLALTLALLALSGSKATFLPVFVCGAVAAWFATLVLRRRFDRDSALLVLLLVAVSAFAQIVIFGGQRGAMRFDPWQTPEQMLINQDVSTAGLNVALMTGFMLTGWLLYGVGVAGLGRRVLDPRAVWMLVAIPAGVTVALLFFRTGLSQLWFSRTVAPLVVLVSAWGLSLLLPRPLRARHVAALSGVVVATGWAAYGISLAVQDASGDLTTATPLSMWFTVGLPFAVLLVYLTVRLVTRLARRRQAPPRYGLLVVLLSLGAMNVVNLGQDIVTGEEVAGPTRDEAEDIRPLFTKGGAAAAEYIARHSPLDDVVATNVHCARPNRPICDNRSFWVSAYSERRVVVQGWGYTAPTNKTAQEGMNNALLPVPFPERLRTNDAVFLDPGPETLRALVREYGADWLFVSKRYDADRYGLRRLEEETGVIREAFRNQRYIVYRVVDRVLDGG